MPSGHRVSEDLAWTIIQMLSLLPLSHVSAYSGLSIRKIKAIKALIYHQTGEVTNDPVSRKGRRALWSRDINVSKDDSYALVSYAWTRWHHGGREDGLADSDSAVTVALSSRNAPWQFFSQNSLWTSYLGYRLQYSKDQLCWGGPEIPEISGQAPNFPYATAEEHSHFRLKTLHDNFKYTIMNIFY